MAACPFNIDSVPDFMKDPNLVLKDKADWLRNGVAPNYDKVNQMYEKEKSNTHSDTSLAALVSNLIKNWEKEASHKTKYSDWRTVDQSKFKISVNGGPFASGDAVIGIGTYNALIGDTEYYAGSQLSFEQSHDIFRNSLTGGFAWEVLQVYSGPPQLVFKWRHWGKVTGQLKCPTNQPGKEFIVEPKGQGIEIFGICIVDVNEEYQMTKIEIYFDPNDIFKRMIKENESS